MGVDYFTESIVVTLLRETVRALNQGERRPRNHFLVVWLLVKGKFAEVEAHVCYAFECLGFLCLVLCFKLFIYYFSI